MNTRDDVIRVLRTLDGYDAYVAGGWIRDTIMGVAPKDIDIFIIGEPNSVTVRFAVAGILNGGKYYGRYEDCTMREDVAGVLKYDAVDLVLMKADTIDDVLENFDISACQIYGKLVGDSIEVYASPDFIEFQNGGKVYQYTNVVTCEKHVARVKEKYGTLTPKVMGEIELIHIGTI